jgi:hypothetical protein
MLLVAVASAAAPGVVATRTFWRLPFWTGGSGVAVFPR